MPLGESVIAGPCSINSELGQCLSPRVFPMARSSVLRMESQGIATRSLPGPGASGPVIPERPAGDRHSSERES